MHEALVPSSKQAHWGNEEATDQLLLNFDGLLFMVTPEMRKESGKDSQLLVGNSQACRPTVEYQYGLRESCFAVFLHVAILK